MHRHADAECERLLMDAHLRYRAEIPRCLMPSKTHSMRRVYMQANTQYCNSTLLLSQNNFGIDLNDGLPFCTHTHTRNTHTYTHFDTQTHTNTKSRCRPEATGILFYRRCQVLYCPQNIHACSLFSAQTHSQSKPRIHHHEHNHTLSVAFECLWSTERA